MRYACPICGDPNAFLVWLSPEPPEGCPLDMKNWATVRAVRNVSECKWQMQMAWQSAQFRKLVPDAFDADGKMKSGQLGRVLTAFGDAHPGKDVVI